MIRLKTSSEVCNNHLGKATMECGSQFIYFIRQTNAFFLCVSLKEHQTGWQKKQAICALLIYKGTFSFY